MILGWLLYENLRWLPALGLEAEHFPPEQKLRDLYSCLSTIYEEADDPERFLTDVELLALIRAENAELWPKASEAIGADAGYYGRAYSSAEGIPAPVLSYVRVLRRDLARRVVREQVERVSKMAAKDPNPAKLIDELEQARLTIQVRHTEAEGPAEDRPRGSQILAESMQRGDRVHLGWNRLSNRMGGGLPRGDVLTVGGKPGTGKTAWALETAARILTSQPLSHVVFVSLEMPAPEIIRRQMQAFCCLESHALEHQLAAASPEWPGRSATEFDALFARRFHLWEHTLTVPQIEGAVASLREPNIALVVVDFLGRVRVPGVTPPYERISAIVEGLKNMVKALRVPVLALSQLSRAVPDQATAPTLASFRDSGAIEEGSDFAAGLWRPNYSDEVSEQRQTAELRLGLLKSKHGRPGTLEYSYHLATQRIDEVGAGAGGTVGKLPGPDRTARPSLRLMAGIVQGQGLCK